MKKLVSKQLYKQRIFICKKCPSYNDSLNTCKECGCFLLVKAALTITECPLGKWKNEN